MAGNDKVTFGEARKRLDEIVVEVRNKNLSLEKSLDLYEEAIKLGNRCAERVDKPDYTEDEALAAQAAMQGADEAPAAEDAPAAAEAAADAE